MIVSWLLALALVQDADQSPASRPAELLQSKSCKSEPSNPAASSALLPSDRLVGLDSVPPCLAQTLRKLEASASQLVGNPEATAVIQVGIGRGFGATGLLFSAPDDPQIHYVEDISSLTDILSAEWSDYSSPDGDLGWSGFVMVIDKAGAQVRFSTSPDSPLDAYDATLRLEAEFFPGKHAAIVADGSEPAR